jgi:hypothetical protein
MPRMAVSSISPPKRDVEWGVVLLMGILQLIHDPRPPAIVALNLHEVLMVICVDE